MRAAPNVELYKIDVELGLSAWNNARRLYYLKKQVLTKQEKTLEATNKALKAAEFKAKVAMKEAKQQQQIAKLRKTYWFEKFHWFISSDNLLVIAGRDAQQNELIVKKYMDREHDIYVHAQITGASSVVIKNTLRLKQMPPRTIQEAGQFCVCRSRAWKSNVSIQSYWVYAHQVSKTPPSGQFLPTGSFILRGKRHFIPQQPLLMAVALLFRIDHRSKQMNHAHEREISYFDHEHANDANGNDDVMQQFIAGTEAAEQDGKLKKRAHHIQNDENSIYVTKTLVQSNPKARKEFEEKEKKEKKELSKTEKKLAKHGFTKKDNKVLSKREKNKRSKRSKYHQMYDDKDRKLVQQLLGIQPRTKQTAENAEPAQLQDQQASQEPVDGYELNANPAAVMPEQQEEEQQEEEEEEEEEEDEYDKQRRYALCNNLDEELSLLTGRVHEKDVVLYCMVMCAPYSAIANNDEYQHTIKIQSGGSKRGKAVKHVYDLFENQLKASAVNDKLNLLSIYKSSVKDTEISHVFLSDVKLSAPGLKTLQLQHKQQQKQKQKEQWKSQQQHSKQNKTKQTNATSVNPKKRKKKK